MTKVVQHIWEAIRHENAARIEPVFDRDQPIRETGDMRTWFTGKPCAGTARSHINFCVFDSTWEASDAFALDHSPEVEAWVKNDHLGFEVFYVHRGVVRKYRPDFLIGSSRATCWCWKRRAGTATKTGPSAGTSPNGSRPSTRMADSDAGVGMSP